MVVLVIMLLITMTAVDGTVLFTNRIAAHTQG